MRGWELATCPPPKFARKDKLSLSQEQIERHGTTVKRPPGSFRDFNCHSANDATKVSTATSRVKLHAISRFVRKALRDVGLG